MAMTAAGSFGIIFGSAIIALSNNFPAKFSQLNIDSLAEALEYAISRVQEIGRCKPGDRTFLDMLIALRECQSLQQAEKKLEKERWQIASLEAKKGRSRYLGGR